MAKFRIAPGREGQFNGVAPALIAILKTAAASAPPNIAVVEAFSGKAGRATGTTNHPSGRAVDFNLYDTSNRKLDNYYGNPFGVHSLTEKQDFQTYEAFAQTARQAQQRLYPELSDKFRWGGYFQGGVNPGDSMHFDLSGGGKGLPPQTDRWQNGMPVGTLAGVSRGNKALPGGVPGPTNLAGLTSGSDLAAHYFQRQPPAGAPPATAFSNVPMPNLRPAQRAIATNFPIASLVATGKAASGSGAILNARFPLVAPLPNSRPASGFIPETVVAAYRSGGEPAVRNMVIASSVKPGGTAEQSQRIIQDNATKVAALSSSRGSSPARPRRHSTPRFQGRSISVLSSRSASRISVVQVTARL